MSFQSNLVSPTRVLFSVSTLDSPLPLLSPFIERQPCKSHFIAKSCPCTPPKKRRSQVTGSSRSSRRYRHCSRIDCPFASFHSRTTFDQLSWISAMDSTPDLFDPSDMADLSQLPVDIETPPLGPGPIRRRKTSLRSTPFPPHNQPPVEPLSPPSNSLLPSPFISHDLSVRDPRTPPRDPIPQSQIRFRNLLPYFDSPKNGASQ